MGYTICVQPDGKKDSLYVAFNDDEALITAIAEVLKPQLSLLGEVTVIEVTEKEFDENMRRNKQKLRFFGEFA